MGTTPPPLDFGAASAPISPTGQPLAPPGRRVVARLLDFVIVTVVIGGVVYRAVVGETISVDGNADDADWTRVLSAAALMLVISFVWDAVFTKVTGGTPMKLALGMRVVRSDNGRPVDWSNALSRWGVVAIWTVIPFGSLVVLIMAIVSLYFIFARPLRQAVWDQVAKTLVVKPA